MCHNTYNNVRFWCFNGFGSPQSYGPGMRTLASALNECANVPDRKTAERLRLLIDIL
jgi:hypothetical protein